MYCSYCLSENVETLENEGPTGVSFLGVSEVWNETYTHCHDCNDECGTVDELPEVSELTREEARQIARAWKHGDMPLHVAALLVEFENLAEVA